MKAEIPITWFDSIDSTNSEARRQLPANAKMSVYAAKFQTAGRGQRGNKWSSAAGQNLTFSVLLNFTHPQMPDLLSGISFSSALSRHCQFLTCCGNSISATASNGRTTFTLADAKYAECLSRIWSEIRVLNIQLSV